MILTNCYIKIGTHVVSDKTTSVAVNQSRPAVDMTAMGDGTRKNDVGIREWSMAFEFNADASVIADLYALYDAGAAVPVEVRADAGAVSVSNPAWAGDAVITEFSPLDGGVNDKQTLSVSVVSAGTLSFLTAPVV